MHAHYSEHTATSVQGCRHAPTKCPAGHDRLMEQRVLHGIQVDVCLHHNAFWLDGGEHEELVRIHRSRGERTSQGTGPAQEGQGIITEMVGDIAQEAAIQGVGYLPEIIELGAEAADVLEAVLGFVLEALLEAF